MSVEPEASNAAGVRELIDRAIGRVRDERLACAAVLDWVVGGADLEALRAGHAFVDARSSASGST